MADRLTPEREAEIRARLAAATPGPWQQTWDIKRGVKLWGRDGEPLYLAISPLAHSRISDADPVPQWQKDADFVRNALTDLAAALDEIQRLRSALHDAEAIGDFPEELRDRLALKEAAACVPTLQAEVEQLGAVCGVPHFNRNGMLAVGQELLRLRAIADAAWECWALDQHNDTPWDDAWERLSALVRNHQPRAADPMLVALTPRAEDSHAQA